MSEIRPFAGLRPRADLVAEIAAPPYDVLDRQEAQELLRRHPLSFMRVIRADVELGTDVSRLDDEVFLRGQRNLTDLIEKGHLIQDAAPSFYLYELTMGGHVQTGLVAAASLAEYEQGLVKRHERTRTPELEGRTKHIDRLSANTGPVFLTYHSDEAVDALIELLKQAQPAYDFSAEDGVRHRFWVVNAPDQVEALQQRFRNVPALYIADGHHRTAASARVRKLRNDRGEGTGNGEAPWDYFLAVMFPHDQLRILAYNRVVLDIGGKCADEIKAAIAEEFDVEPTNTPVPPEPKMFGMYLDKKWYRLKYRAANQPIAELKSALDASILQDHVLAPVFGIEQPRTDPRIKFVGGVRGTADLERIADASGGMAFSLYPVSIEKVMDIADAGEVMPPKSTWFEPKLRSGMVVRSIDAGEQLDARFFSRKSSAA